VLLLLGKRELSVARYAAEEAAGCWRFRPNTENKFLPVFPASPLTAGARAAAAVVAPLAWSHGVGAGFWDESGEVFVDVTTGR